MTFDPSPSLVTSADRAAEPDAYEVKFFVPADLAGRVEAWARRNLSPDSHGDEGRYRTTSLYCDTDALDAYHRTPGFGRAKHRLRRYGESALVYLERKKRKGDGVRKRRVGVPDDELALLGAEDVSPDWAGDWFLRKLRVRGLKPRCQISYTRTAFLGDSSTGPIRLTLDRDATGEPSDRWEVTPVRDGKRLLPDGVILELKYRSVIPPAFRELLAELPQGGGGVSKYRRCIDACGLAGGANGCRSLG